MKPWLLKLHRWVALIFALPLLFVLGTGLILSIEPWLVVRAIEPHSLTTDRVVSLLERHDPGGAARALTYRSYDGTLGIGGGRGGGTVVDVASGEQRSAPSALASMLGTMRSMHERLLFNLGWLVTGSTAAMLVLVVLGMLMGWPRIANTLSGWHKAMAWGTLPLIVLSPLTGLMLAFGINMSATPPSVPRGTSMSLREAVAIVGRTHDLSTLVWIRPRGGRMMVRLAEGGEYTAHAVTPTGTVPMPRNWPRLWHEGNFAGGFSAALNVIASIAMIGLLGTGIWIWLRRQRRRSTRRAQRFA